MSHKATNWLSDLPPEQLNGSEFRVLFHLCDCHNRDHGCYPTQAYLMKWAGVSNGTVNNALNGLESKGLIRRHVSVDPVTKRKRPTRYILGFEMETPQEPTPDNGDGAISKSDPEPSPNNGPSHLQPTGDKPVSKPGKNLRARADAISAYGERAVELAEFWAPKVASDGYVPTSAISIAAVNAMIAMKLATRDQCRAKSLHFTDPTDPAARAGR